MPTATRNDDGEREVMTLDDLIEQLVTLRTRYPAAGTAGVRHAWQCDLARVEYARGRVQFGQGRRRPTNTDAARIHTAQTRGWLGWEPKR